MKYLLFTFMMVCLLGSCQNKADSFYAPLPYPQELVYTNDQLVLDEVQLNCLEEEGPWEEWLKEMHVEMSQKAGKSIQVERVNRFSAIPFNQEEAYQVEITQTKVAVKSVTAVGAYRALQTLQQLVRKENGKYFLPTCQITDWPAFRMRGLMQDVGRSYISMAELKREIDLLSRFKINVFHWHLTENQAWRLESKVYPELNASENMTRMPGKYYTQEEAKELVEFCKQRHVMLIPEIDMPGHSEAFVRTFHTDMQSEKGMAILKKLMDEVCETFDVPYIHIGTDEVKFTNPRFVPEMVDYVRSKGKKVISWNPGWKYKEGEIDMTQLWSFRGKAQPGIPAIDCRFHYINHFDLFADIVALYNSRIYNQEHGDEQIAGSILAVWNDRYIEDEKQNAAENNLYAAMLALAERSWRGGGYGYFDGETTLLRDKESEMFAQFADFEKRMLWHKKYTFAGEPFPYVKQTDVVWRITDAFPNGGDLTRTFPPEQEEKDTYSYEGKTYGSRTVYGAGVYLRHVWGTLVPGFYEQPEKNHTAYASTWVYSPQEQQAGLLLEFQNYSRSESDLPPRQGTWDYKGSRAWLNGEELLPPAWENTHTERSNEVPLKNENAVSRPPLQVTLHKGWNRLLLKLPVGEFNGHETRLVKWMFNAVFVTPDGKEALPHLTYSADRITE